MRKISSIIKSLDIDNVEKDNLIFDFELELSKTDSKKLIRKFKLSRGRYQILKLSLINFRIT